MPVRLSPFVLALLALLPCRAQASPDDAPSPALKERIARLALKQVDFGAISILPIIFARSRLTGPIQEDGRTIYCVSTHMKGRSFDGDEKPKAVMEVVGDRPRIIDEDEVCTGHRSKPFPELDALGNAR
jgi:hypothetical protein